MTAQNYRPEAIPVGFDLRDRYRARTGPVLLTGVQAIARLLAEQHAADAAAGLRTASFVSGYQGSPLGGLDKILAAAPELAQTAGLEFVPGVNEELAATAVWGSQVAVPGHGRTVDGVVGVWYGKAPGVDRAGDPMRHGNMCGAHPAGGVLVLAGDDPGCKSSTIPCISERTLAGYGLPVLYPSNAQEIVRLGRYGVALSRASGMWVGMKITADVADGVYTLSADCGEVEITVPELEWEGRGWVYEQVPMLIPPGSLRAEAQLYGPRRAMLRAFLAANPINTVEVDPPEAWLGIVAGGKVFTDVRQVLRDLGLDDPDPDTACRRAGIRLLRLGMIHPVERELLREFAAGLDTVLVVEEKSAFVESAVRDALYGLPDAPAVLGERDADGVPLVPVAGELTAGALAAPLRRVLDARVALAPPSAPRPVLEILPVERSPYFCSGCPHNRSTVVPDGAVAGGGIGCHAMVAITPQPSSEVSSITQMGGEGAQWIGQSPFTTAGHMYQNIGDGTFAHSGQLAVQACVAAGVSITFKLLYNRAVAMTGGQDAEGGLEVPALAAKLLAEGVKKIIVCADEPERYRALPPLPAGVDLWHRDRFAEAQRMLAEVEGVTVLVYDQRCAAESRRMRKRGTLPVRPMRVVINEAVCEGCGDCGAKSNCLSVQPVDTEFGRKTRIDQTSCNTDYSCLDGDCPSFVTVELPPGAAPAKPPVSRPEPPPVPDVSRGPDGDVFLAGIGGTGIVTVNQVLGSAAVRDGLAVHGVDQTGLSQKAGPVTSHLRIAADEAALGPANRIGPAQAGCYLAFDPLVGADPRNLGYASSEATTAVVSTSTVPTGAMVRDASVAAPDPDALVKRIARVSREVVRIDAQAAAHALFGDTMPANLLLVGAAYQSGALPLSAAAIEWAIALNGVAVAVNTAAFRWGRAAVADPAAFAAATTGPAAPGTGASRLPTGIDLGELAGETRRLVEIRAAQLVGFSDERTARRYVADVLAVWRAERAVGEATGFSAAVAHGLHKLIAYKDEYEVARLLTDPDFEARLAAEVPGGRRLRYRLQPPLLRAMGRDTKIAFGPWLRPVLKALARGKVLRGTPFDPFGRTAVRKLERLLAAEYRALMLRLAASLTAETYATALAAAQAADLVRGYEDIKLAGVERYRARLAALGVG
ncbi:indolepyruvate ferredoxin oxidoreductase family protein [Pseudonocardia asaccharolytica]|uniref:Indolepyruvate ferredoxin oxidoreductase n=1 Tax=Pseudonocardia asaccharolytica DSM 44247 = NBRC 16224 TaxID=1123024 RepID=A0A511DCI4_9PSEU|nr:indolepyruvate ferredoxin oxidoreductase family protein [Pseudonocardia asaccharolytica]GEL20668.1 indolepyruvate ferredoxin oxidoreductase [Pseudonocardia asaccharolytica DSM 44247 = NBRC 16224]